MQSPDTKPGKHQWRSRWLFSPSYSGLHPLRPRLVDSVHSRKLLVSQSSIRDPLSLLVGPHTSVPRQEGPRRRAGLFVSSDGCRSTLRPRAGSRGDHPQRAGRVSASRLAAAQRSRAGASAVYGGRAERRRPRAAGCWRLLAREVVRRAWERWSAVEKLAQTPSRGVSVRQTYCGLREATCRASLVLSWSAWDDAPGRRAGLGLLIGTGSGRCAMQSRQLSARLSQDYRTSRVSRDAALSKGTLLMQWAVETGAGCRRKILRRMLWRVKLRTSNHRMIQVLIDRNQQPLEAAPP
jgi:hypothetical protein